MFITYNERIFFFFSMCVRSNKYFIQSLLICLLDRSVLTKSCLKKKSLIISNLYSAGNSLFTIRRSTRRVRFSLYKRYLSISEENLLSTRISSARFSGFRVTAKCYFCKRIRSADPHGESVSSSGCLFFPPCRSMTFRSLIKKFIGLQCLLFSCRISYASDFYRSLSHSIGPVHSSLLEYLARAINHWYESRLYRLWYSFQLFIIRRNLMAPPRIRHNFKE